MIWSTFLDTFLFLVSSNGQKLSTMSNLILAVKFEFQMWNVERLIFQKRARALTMGLRGLLELDLSLEPRPWTYRENGLRGKRQGWTETTCFDTRVNKQLVNKQ